MDTISVSEPSPATTPPVNQPNGNLLMVININESSGDNELKHSLSPAVNDSDDEEVIAMELERVGIIFLALSLLPCMLVLMVIFSVYLF